MNNQKTVSQMNTKELDEWGDPIGEWKTLIDFRTLYNGEGAPVDDVIEALKNLQAEDKNRAYGKSNTKVPQEA